MGRGAHAAHAAYNGSGTQALAVTDKINENEEIKSVFLTENDTTRQILHGHNISEMTSTGKSESISSERYKIFTPDENSDMLGDIYLNFEMDSKITDIKFEDKSSSNTEYFMDRFTPQSRRLDLKLAGGELKSLDIDLNTNEIPDVVAHKKLEDLGFEVINQTRFIKISGTVYQFIVGKGDSCNIAWREYGNSNWEKVLFASLKEVNCVIAAPKWSSAGIVIFGGVPYSTEESTPTAVATIKDGSVDEITVTLPRVGVYNSTPPTVTISEPEGVGGVPAAAAVPVIAGGYATWPGGAASVTNGGSGYTSVPTVTISPPNRNPLFFLYMNDFSNPALDVGNWSFYPYPHFPLNSSQNPYYEVVYTLEYYGSDGADGADKIIVSGSKDHTGEYFNRGKRRDYSDFGYKQTCVLLTSNMNQTPQKVKFKHSDQVFGGFDPIVSSSFSDTTGESFISTGDKSESLILGIDSNGKLIRSYDNGKKWTLASFYHGDGENDFYRHEDDSEFTYYIPVLDYVISNNVGGWYAIGKQGVQPKYYLDGLTERESKDYYRQFVFYSDNDGWSWYPLALGVYDWPGLDKFWYEEIVEYLEPHLLIAWGSVEIPLKVSMGTKDSRGNDDLQHPVMIPFGLNSYTPEPPVIALGDRVATWPFKHGGAYLFPEVTGTFDYDYIGVVNDRKRPIYYGYNSTNKGVISCRQENLSGPVRTYGATVGRAATRTSLFIDLYPKSIKYAYRDLLIGVFSNTKTAQDGSNTHVYRFKKSLDGITWNDITINESDTISSTKDPLIEGDKYGNFIVAVFSGNKYNLYRYNINSSNLEILFDDTPNITDVFAMNFVSNEWHVAVKIGDDEYLLKSYSLTKWQKVANDFDGIKVRKISYKNERVNHVIYRTTAANPNGNPEQPLKNTDILGYNIMYSPSAEAGGVFPFRGENLSSNQGDDGGLQVRYYDVDNFESTKVNKEPNDIIHVNGKTFIACNKRGVVDNSTDFDFSLVESKSYDGSNNYKESETIYGTVGKVPVTSFADNLSRLYSSPRDPEIIFTVGNFEAETNPSVKYGVILHRISATSNTYDLAPSDGGYYWRVLMGPPLTYYDSSYYANDKRWIVSDFENITDVAVSKTSSEMVVVGEGKSGAYNLVIFQDAYIDDFREYTTQKLDFEIIHTVCNLGNLWVVGGKPSQSDDPVPVFNNKCVAYTFDLENWKYIDFTDGAVVPGVTMPASPFFTVTSRGTSTTIAKSTNFEANDIKPIELYGQTGILLQISFNHNTTNDTNGMVIPDSGDVAEKIYFMYVSGENLIIKQNSTYPEPSISFNQNRKQLVPSFTIIINNVERRLVATDYANEFNLFYVTCENDIFKLTNYSSNHLFPNISGNGTKPGQRFRKLIHIDEESIIKRTNGHCYKIATVKNENFVTGVNSARYVAVGKGNFSNIFWSDDLIYWNDSDTSEIFDIVFDVTHKHGIWVAAGEGKYQVAISKDGKKWNGIDSRYTNNLPEIIADDVSFTSLDYHDATDDNVADVLPYVPDLKGIFLRNLSLLRLFSRIEYHVGAQIWQTLTFDDIKAMLDTEIGTGEYKNLLKNCSIINKNKPTRFTTWIPGFTKTLNSKLETFSNISESGSFPSGLLKDQKLSIKIYYNKLENVIGDTLESSDMNNAVFDNFMNNTLIPTDIDTDYYIDSFLADNYGFQLGPPYKNVNGKFSLKFSTEIQKFRLYCKKFELDDIEIDRFNKGIKQVPKITQSLYFDADNTGNLLLDLDSFNLYASHIIVSGWLNSEVHITDMNLELNGYTYQKIIEPSVIDYATKSYLGLNCNTYTFNGVDKENGTGSLVIPLASTAYSGSSVPLDRYSSIRLRINFNTLAGPKSYINVTCVGTTTVSYNNSTANIEMY